MREIKFRFVYRGDYRLHYKIYYLDEFETKSLKELSDVHHQMPLISKDQYTGLKDKNGKEIYEGDILDIENASGEVCFHKEYLGFFVKVSEFEQEWKPLYDIPIPEIIGNIHENKELLNG